MSNVPVDINRRTLWTNFSRRHVIDHRRNTTGQTSLKRNRKNSLTTSKSVHHEHDSIVESFVPPIHVILNEHLTMINQLLEMTCLPMSYGCAINSFTCVHNEFFRCLTRFSRQYPMQQRCSIVATKSFVDFILNFRVHRSHRDPYRRASINILKSLSTSNSNETNNDSVQCESIDSQNICRLLFNKKSKCTK
jgi:hypothetical protein